MELIETSFQKLRFN